MSGRKPGYLVEYTDKDGNTQKGRTYHSESPINGKKPIHLLTDTFHDQLDEKGVQVKMLVENTKLRIIGMCD